jgi:SfnB family sulfur acquisition oxidoreductase
MNVVQIPPAMRSLAASDAAPNEAAVLATAQLASVRLAASAAQRDRERALPYAELDDLSVEGLFALTVPKAFDGPGVSAATLAEVFARLAEGDTSIAQIPQSHYYMTEALRLQGSSAQQRFFFARVLAGERIANALSERGTKTAREIGATLRRSSGGWRLNGRKFYCTGVLFAHWIAAVALDEIGRRMIAFVPRDARGVTMEDDWTGFGQRTTGSGTTLFDDVAVDDGAVLPLQPAFDRPTRLRPFSQLLHAAIDQGAARAALVDTVRFVRDHARPWTDSGVARAAEDPYTIAQVGDVRVRVQASGALLRRAARLVEEAAEEPSAEQVAAASVAVAEAKVAATESSLLAASRLIELGGSSATLASHNLDRHWRNVRTHTVHDPARWKLRAVGDYWLNGTLPPRHGQI